jgi:hypothetical protein
LATDCSKKTSKGEINDDPFSQRMNKPFVGWMILFDQLDETREWIVAESPN